MTTTITRRTTVADLVGFWLEHLRAEQRLDQTTIDENGRVLNKLVIPSLGTTIISDLTTRRVNELLVELGAQSLNRKRKAKVVLGAMLDTAVEVGALPVNPVRGSLSISRPAPDHRSLTEAELETVRTAVQAWLSKERSGPKSSGDIAEIIEVMLATGARIGEVLALRWADIELGARVIDINATIKTESGVGTYRKALARPRPVALPEGAARILQARRRTSPDNFLDAVFPTRNVTWQQANNVERRWRQIRRETGLEWVTPDASAGLRARWNPAGRPCRDARQRRRHRSRSRPQPAARPLGRPDGSPRASRPGRRVAVCVRDGWRESGRRHGLAGCSDPR
ncbi:MAG: tyrosine-type recombinase/integrase [Actinomycetota bacterium]|nr:tyrosine-type recombinase/integrase [Actinomycetota bacterium]